MNYNPSNDQLILLGDYVDRGTNSKAIVEQVKKLHEECGVIVLKGNHDKMQHLDFLSSVSLYNETKEHIFVHAGINPEVDDWKNQNAYDFIWIREPFYRSPVTATNKTVVFGHTSTVDLHNREVIWFSPHGDKIGIDGGCAYGQRLNCLEICDGEY